jgi:hypothetical protein
MRFARSTVIVGVDGENIEPAPDFFSLTRKTRDRAVPLIEQVFEFFRKERILPPTLVQTEKLIWIVLRLAEDHLYNVLTSRLTQEHKTRLDALL